MTVYVKQNSLIVNTYFLLVLRFVFQEHGDFTWRVSDCEKLVGGLLTGDDGGCFRVLLTVSLHPQTFQ